MYAPAERADTLPLFLLYPYMYSVDQTMEEATARADLIYSGIKDGEILHRGADTNVGRNLWHPHTGIPQPTLIYQTDVRIVQLGWGGGADNG